MGEHWRKPTAASPAQSTAVISSRYPLVMEAPLKVLADCELNKLLLHNQGQTPMFCSPYPPGNSTTSACVQLPISLLMNGAEKFGATSAGLTVNTGDLTLQSTVSGGAMMDQEEWPPRALIGKDDFIGFSSSSCGLHSPQPSTSPSAALLVYEAPSSPTSNSVGDPFGRHHAARNDQYGSEGISPSPSSYVSSSCSSLQSEDHQYQSQHGHTMPNVLHYHQSSGQHAVPSTASSSNIASSHIMAPAGNQNMLSCFDQSPYQRSPPGYSLAVSPPLFTSQSNMLFSPSSGNSNYSTALTHSPLHLPSFASTLTERHQHKRRCNDQLLEQVPSRHKPLTKTVNTVVVKGELSETEEGDGGMLGYRLEEDYDTHPPENYFQLGEEEEEQSTAGSNDYGAYSIGKSHALMPLDTSGMHSSTSSSPSMSVLSREMILHDKMMPLTPPKTRSKMHDLAVKHQLITNQNTRGHGTIQLSSEEKRTLLQEGYTLPTRLPLSRDEEEALKIARRKIKNKLSAQESRRKRKEYMDSLEKKVHDYFGDNVLLKNRIKQLEALNRDLLSQVKKLQNAVESCPQL